MAHRFSSKRWRRRAGGGDGRSVIESDFSGINLRLEPFSNNSSLANRWLVCDCFRVAGFLEWSRYGCGFQISVLQQSGLLVGWLTVGLPEFEAACREYSIHLSFSIQTTANLPNWNPYPEKIYSRQSASSAAQNRHNEIQMNSSQPNPFAKIHLKFAHAHRPPETHAPSHRTLRPPPNRLMNPFRNFQQFVYTFVTSTRLVMSRK